MRAVDDRTGGYNPFETGPERAQVAVVDDHVLVGRLVVGLLERAGYTAAHAFGETLDETWKLIELIQPEVILLDFDLGPLQSALALLERAVAAELVVAGFTGSDDRIEHATFLEGGAAAIVPKASGPADLIAVVELALAGEELMAPDERHVALSRLRKYREARRRDMAAFAMLTQREQETLSLLAAGQGAGEIAELWEVAMPTVRSHIRSVLAKLGVTSQLQAAAMARESGWYAEVAQNESSILTMPSATAAGTISRRSGSKG